MMTQAELVWLLAAVAKGDRSAFERLYEATRAKLYGVLLRILGRAALADEVLKETYLRVWNVAAKFDPTTASPITWMVAIARNRAIDIARKSGNALADETPDALTAAEAPPPLARRDMTEDLKSFSPVWANSIRKSSVLCCLPITAAGAASSLRKSSIFR